MAIEQADAARSGGGLAVSRPAGRGAVALALGLVYVIWGSIYLAVRLVITELPPLGSMGLRFIAAGLLMGLFLGIRSGFGQFALTWRQCLGVVFMGTILLAMGNGLTSLGQLKGVPSGITALIIATVPLWIAMYRTISGDRPSAMSLIGVGAGLAGLIFLISAGPGVDGGGLPLVGVVIILISSLSWSFGSWIQPRIWLPRSPFVAATYQLVVAGSVMSLGALAVGESFDGTVGTRTWGALAYLVLIGSIIGFTSYVWLLGNAPVSLVATHAYVNPVVAIFLGWLVLSEPVTVPVLIGGGVVVLSVILVVGGERASPDVTRNGRASHPVGG
ncbi:EamA family transporter [Rhodococcoides kyotonense]|uniref:Permease of the drug/metabolite transporter (DMT) superfamily n=1 Tax=Rhodococcoides kyotonense TaxID=398843 RepID=A0A239K1E6_9NOCA|nr:EamA family transporter [Rhodococcus kyotonensis]SNT11855.1 Permease of the drug/metabolite transporter (DMT) superfamily [Rhodococcus kyotonensis]